MNWIKRLIQKRRQRIASNKLKTFGLKFNRNTLGTPSFLTNEIISENGLESNYDIIYLTEFTSNQFRAMADYIDAFPDSTKVLSED